ncbi:uncharacterized protein LOC133160076 isoform X2 [Syngnathus typhle]|uniref:uncharacterized protein LOC133160076 isoform X2 n=1 Tax=Syngnathus typhle TaxID=161592 RepID=UPI002A69D187|nr:uncharacterized protein LOC133160076 isoform X2 [Syngnathus typhle]
MITSDSVATDIPRESLDSRDLLSKLYVLLVRFCLRFSLSLRCFLFAVLSPFFPRVEALFVLGAVFCEGNKLLFFLTLHSSPLPALSLTEAAPALQVREEEVPQMFRRQKTRKASGPAGVSPSCLKVCAEQLAPSFARLFNHSLELCEVPSCSKSSTIVPVAKKPAITVKGAGQHWTSLQPQLADLKDTANG